MYSYIGIISKNYSQQIYVHDPTSLIKKVAYE